MISFTRLGIPIIVSLIVGGLISFIIVLSFYPEKHENVQVNGKCFELKGTAHNAYNNLLAQSKKNYLNMLTSKISNSNAMIPITLTGQNIEIYKFIDKNDIDVTSRQNITFYPNTEGSVVMGNVSGMNLSAIVNNLTLSDLMSSSKSIAGSISIIPNKQITQQEFENALLLEKGYVQNGLRSMIKNSADVTQAECRYQPEPNN